MIQSSQPVWSRREEPNLSESSLAGWAPVLAFAALTLGPFALAMRALRSHPPNWIQTNLAPRGETKTVGLVESFGAPPQNLGQLHNVAGMLLGALPPDPHRGSAPRPPPEQGLGRSSTGSGVEHQWETGVEPPATLLQRSCPGFGVEPQQLRPTCPPPPLWL